MVLKLFPAALVLLTAVGCGGPPSVSGVVTYEDKPIEKGSISFSPADGHGTPVGGMIRDGEYRIENAVTGKQRVAISGYEIPPVPPGSNAPVYTKEIVPPNAVGNGQEVEIVPGAQTMDFHLKPPQ